MIKAYFDGCCEPVNPGGYASYGVYIYNKEVVLSKGMFVGNGKGISNNVAEYAGLVYILEFLKVKGLNKERIKVFGDSQLAIKQMQGEWRIKRGFYVPVAMRARELLKDFKKISFQWIPREENEICDKLAKDILRDMRIRFRIQPETT